MRSIVVPVAGRPECAKALNTAFLMAQALSANVCGYHIRPHRLEAKRKPKEKGRFIALPGLSDFVESLSDQRIELNAKAAHKLFAELSEQQGFALRRTIHMNQTGGQSTWNELVGSLQAQFSIIGPLADLIVVSRPKSEKSAKARAFALAALMHSARPVLVLPQRATGRVGKRILIAWNQSVDAAAIVHAALPLLQIAEDVHIMSAGSQDLCAPKTRAVAKYLRHWGVNATTSQTPGRHATQELLTTYAERKCDLFMMGAYSRARWRETVFGGLTEHILFKEHIPALLMHR